MSSSGIAGYARTALDSLTAEQVSFLESLPKAELHAHLNGSVPLRVLRELASADPETEEKWLGEINKLEAVELNEIHDFFRLFAGINALLANEHGLRTATRAVLEEFLEPQGGRPAQCSYLELRSTPKETKEMGREEYVRVVLDEVERYPKEKAALIVSLDRRMTDEVMRECVDVAAKFRKQGRRVVGIDLCGDPLARDVADFEDHFKVAQEACLKLTLHIAETVHNSAEETLKLLSYRPNRLGHATFLDEEAIKAVFAEKDLGVEICLSSNLLCKSVGSLEAHHIRYYLERNHPIAICTDDILPFRNSLLGEYALLLAQPPIGLGLKEEEVRRIAQMSLDCRFT